MRTFFFCIGMTFPSVCFAQVVISEVQWAGSPSSSADEWLELANITDETVGLSGWTITKRASDGGNVVMISFPEDAQIAAGEFFLIANYGADKSTLAVSPDLVSTSVSLNNSKLFLQVVDAEGEVVDAIDDGSGSPFAGGKNPYSSMERIDLLSSGEDPNNWKTAEVSLGFDGEQQFGTPGLERGDPSPQMSSNSSDVSSSSSSLECGQGCPRSGIRITEVLLDPKISEDYDWIELGNLGDTPVDITGWILSDGSRSYSIEPRSQSGYILQPQEHTVFFHYQTGIALNNQGEVLTLSNTSGEIDRIDVSATGEEISFGREPDGSRGPFCIPTPREENSEKKLNPQIKLQSGRPTDYIKVTLNLKAVVEEGSLKDAECFWDFKDGTSSAKCNPPSHSWDYFGVYNVTLRVTTFCADEIERGIEVVVLQKNKKSQKMRKSYRSSTSLSPLSSSYSSSNSQSSVQSSIIEQKMYSTTSQYLASRNPLAPQKIRYKNVPQFASSSIVSVRSSYRYSYANLGTQPQSTSQETGLPWVLLFSQSVIWLVLVGKKMI